MDELEGILKREIRKFASRVLGHPQRSARWPAGFPYVCPSPDVGDLAFGLVRSFIPISRGDIVVQDGLSN